MFPFEGQSIRMQETSLDIRTSRPSKDFVIRTTHSQFYVHSSVTKLESMTGERHFSVARDRERSYRTMYGVGYQVFARPDF